MVDFHATTAALLQRTMAMHWVPARMHLLEAAAG